MAVNTEWAQRISRLSADFTKSEKRLLDYITNAPHIAAFASLKELCAATELSKPKVIEFYKKLGYTSFTEFREGLLEFYRQHINSYQASTAAFNKIKNMEELLHAAVEVDTNALARISDDISTEDLTYISEEIRKAGQVFICGPGTGYYPAHFLYQRLKRYCVNVHLIGSDLQHIAEDLFPIEAEDLLLIFHYSHEDTLIKNAMDFATDVGAETVLISEHIHHSYVERVDRILYVHRGEIGFKNSMAVPMAFANVLLLALEFVMGNESRQTLKELERKREKYNLSFFYS